MLLQMLEEKDLHARIDWPAASLFTTYAHEAAANTMCRAVYVTVLELYGQLQALGAQFHGSESTPKAHALVEEGPYRYIQGRVDLLNG